MTLRFGQSCPTCGRRIEVRLELLGRSIACPHCHAEFTASERTVPVPKPEDALMDRVERALRQSQGTIAIK